MSDSAKIRSRDRSGSSRKDHGSGGYFGVKKQEKGILSGKLPVLIGLVVFSLVYWTFFNGESTDSKSGQVKSYAVVIDAGSTGSRVNAYEFDVVGGELKLKSQLFEEIKPGLSSYADKPQDGANGLKELFQKAQDFIPKKYWANTPIALKATAGLRLLPGDKADDILTAVEKVIKDSGFVPGKDSVGIMDGVDEGIFSWFTVNYLLGRLSGSISQTVAALDLGGGSTQITVASSKDTVGQYPKEDIESVPLAGQKVPVYTHSYLGLGLQSARKSILASDQKDPKSKVLESPCIDPSITEEWKHGGETYTVKGMSKAKSADWDLCNKQIVKLINEKSVIKPKDLNRPVVLFSYFFERAVDAGLIDAKAGGKLTIQDYLDAGKKACKKVDEESPFMCLDLTFMGALLHNGYGLTKDTSVLALKKVDGYEINWALGMVYQMLQK